MATPNNLVTFRCPSCGAPIAMGATYGICQYCETVVERPDVHPPPSVRPPASSAPRAAAPVARPQPRSLAGNILVWFSILAVVGFVAYRLIGTQALLGYLGSNHTSNIPVLVPRAGEVGVSVVQTTRISDIAAVKPSSGTTSELVVYLNDDQGRYSVGLVDGLSGEQRWQSMPFSKDVRSGSIVVGANSVYLTDEEQLYALSLDGGTLLWQAPLAAEVEHSCAGCLAVVGERVIALQKDGSLYAYDPQHGKLVWQTQLDESPRQLPRIGDTLLGLHANSEGRGKQVRLLKASDGSSMAQVAPRCVGETALHDAYFDSADRLIPADDNKTFYAVLGGVNTCVQRWTIGNSAPDWHLWLDDVMLMSSMDVNRLKLSDGVLLLSSDDAMTIFDAATGKVRSTFKPDRYRITPLFARDGIAVVDATPTWDSNKHALWGIDIGTGEKRWEHAVQAKEWRGNSLFGSWDAKPTSAGVLLVEALENTHQLLVEQLDLKTGASIGRQVTTLTESGPMEFWDALWSERTAWLRVGQTTYVLDILSGSVVGQLH